MQTRNIKLEWANVDSLQPNPWNTNSVNQANEEKLANSMDRLGMFKPVVVRTLPDGTKQILGGEHRWRIAKNKGDKQLPIVDVGLIDDEKAKEIGLVDNSRYGADDAISLAQLLEGLGDSDELTSFLPYSDSDMEVILASTHVDLSDLELDDEDELGDIRDLTAPVQTHQIMRFKVPVDDAHFISTVIERVMKEQGFTEDDSLTNAGHALVQIFKDI